MTKIKICGLTRMDDIAAVNAAMPDYIGFVFAESRRRVTLQKALELRNALSRDIIPVGVFVDETLENVLSILHSGAISAVQLHGAESEGFIKTLRREIDGLPGKALRREINVPIIKAVSVQKAGDAQAWQHSAADYLLLDHKGGGTGETFDWDLIGEVKKPFFLAGGLSAKNISQAIEAASRIPPRPLAHSHVPETAPFAVDTSSGVEISPGIKCPEKISAFVREVRTGRQVCTEE